MKGTVEYDPFRFRTEQLLLADSVVHTTSSAPHAQSLVMCAVTRTAGRSALVCFGCCVLFCLRSGWLQLLRNSWHTRVNNRCNHVGNKLNRMAITNWYLGWCGDQQLVAHIRAHTSWLSQIIFVCFVSFPRLMMRGARLTERVARHRDHFGSFLGCFVSFFPNEPVSDACTHSILHSFENVLSRYEFPLHDTRLGFLRPPQTTVNALHGMFNQ